MKVLSIISTPWRATLEEQDDTVIWLTHAMIGAGAEIDIILTGEAAGYAAHGLDAHGLALGQRPQSQPPDINRDIKSLQEKGRKVFVCDSSLSFLGLNSESITPGLDLIKKEELVPLFDHYDQVWQW